MSQIVLPKGVRLEDFDELELMEIFGDEIPFEKVKRKKRQLQDSERKFREKLNKPRRVKKWQ